MTMDSRSWISSIFLLLATASWGGMQDASANPVSLEDLWNFGDPMLDDPSLDPNGLRINVLYNVSDFITRPMNKSYSVRLVL